MDFDTSLTSKQTTAAMYGVDSIVLGLGGPDRCWERPMIELKTEIRNKRGT